MVSVFENRREIMTVFKPVAVASAWVLSAAVAQAADFECNGNIQFHNDVVRIDFTLASDATDVRVWTDGFLDP